MKAIDIIHAEHRALGAVVQAFRHVLDTIHSGAKQPDFVLLDALIEYITEVPDKLHHPKEDEVLFVKILEVVPDAATLIAKLQDDHVKGEQSTQHLREALRTYQAAGASGFTEFEAVALRYIDSTWKHISLEEKELLPLAVQRLAPADWAGIDAAFEANKDPWSGPTGEFRALFTKIVNMVPAPHGLGAA
jgi:branched-chain amino acid transport system ATP-binding protein